MDSVTNFRDRFMTPDRAMDFLEGAPLPTGLGRARTVGPYNPGVVVSENQVLETRSVGSACRRWGLITWLLLVVLVQGVCLVHLLVLVGGGDVIAGLWDWFTDIQTRLAPLFSPFGEE